MVPNNGCQVLPHRRTLANADEERVQINDGIDGFERSALPRLRSLENGVGHCANQLRRDFGAVDLLEKTLDFTGRHPAGVEGEYLVVEAGEAT